MTGDRYSADYLEHELRYAWDHHADSTQQRRGESVIDWKTKQSLDDDQFVSISPEEALVPFGLVATTIAHVARTTAEGVILVFFPGLQEIQQVEKLIQQPVLGVDFLDTSKFKIFLLHSFIPATQKAVFSSVPDRVRKIILSTKIGETSITIPNVQHVIDTGKLRETWYDYVKRISSLETTWISKSNAKQRAGRAGRVQNGNYLALYSRARYDSMKAIGLPEILRSDLQATCLTVKSTIRNGDIRQFLAGAVEPPNPAGVDEAVGSLVKMGALTSNEDLTALGKVLASLPIHPALGKMIVLGALFKCLDLILVVGAAAEERGLWIMAPGTKDRTAQTKKSFL
jgi:HrpA-like RNA helicase